MSIATQNAVILSFFIDTMSIDMPSVVMLSVVLFIAMLNVIY